MKQSIVMVASYGGPYGGNFIPSLIAYDKVAKELGYRTVYIFPGFVSKYPWVSEMQTVADKVYFVPYHQYTLDNVKRIRRICKDENAAIIYSRMSGWDITARLAMPRLPMIWHMEMGLDLTTKKQRLKYFFKYRFLGFGKTYHIAVSDKTADVINSLNVKNKCEWIPNAINTKRLNKRKEYSFGKPVKLLTFAYLPEIKGFDIALDACEVLNTDDTNYELMASAQERTHDYVGQRYKDGVPKWLRLIPPTDNISELFDEADILLCPSRSEGLSFANLEALYSGLPVVYSDIPGNKLLADFEMTKVFRTCDCADFAEKIKKSSAAGVSKDCQNRNRNIIEKSFTMNAWAERMKQFIASVILFEESGVKNR